MAEFTNSKGNAFIEEGAKGLNPGLIVLLVVGGLVLLILAGNYALYMYAQKTRPARKRKPVSKKKMKRERLKQGVSAPGE
ncbi:DNA-binding protein S1FA2 [Acorus calamus]|uniref:DNA-binding protein S1FA2 n=1 Tax=Acorus calamus TaxID=4465 RepID=A0AAV9C8S8_ACOCL|nr:DNA-binding protein S1FA2 [Acorus calamus]